MQQTQDKLTLSRKRVLEPQVEGGSKKERKRLKKEKQNQEQGQDQKKHKLKRSWSSKLKNRN